MTLDEYLQQSPEMLKFSEEEWRELIRNDLKDCKLPSRQQIKAIESHWRNGGLPEMILYVENQKKKSEKDTNETKKVDFWNIFIKWFDLRYERNSLKMELDKRLKNVGLLKDDKKENRNQRQKCLEFFAEVFVQTWCAECNYLIKTNKVGSSKDNDERT